jgi:hypothetical protein
MTSSLTPLLFALAATLPLSLGCARGNQTTDASGAGGGSGGASSSSSATGASTTATGAGGSGGGATTTGATGTGGGAVCGDGVVDKGEACDGAAPAGKLCVDCALVDATDPVINEIVYDTSGTDVGCFIEILGPPGLDLTGYTLDAVNGSDGVATLVATLSGQSLGASGYFVLAQDSTVKVAADVTKLIKITADLQNGPDSVVLKHGAVVVDALGYGSFAAGQFFSGEGSSAPASSTSLCRIPGGKDTGDNSADFVACAPSPGAANKVAP